MNNRLELIMPKLSGDETRSVIKSLLDSLVDTKVINYYVLGGVYYGDHYYLKMDGGRLEDFWEACRDLYLPTTKDHEGFVRASDKEKGMIDGLWKEMFPHLYDENIGCPWVFQSVTSYVLSALDCNSKPLSFFNDVDPSCHVAGMVAIASRGCTRINWLYQKRVFNGINGQDTHWDGTVKEAIYDYNAMTSSKEDKPDDTWVAITFEYN